MNFLHFAILARSAKKSKIPVNDEFCKPRQLRLRLAIPLEMVGGSGYVAKFGAVEAACERGGRGRWNARPRKKMRQDGFGEGQMPP